MCPWEAAQKVLRYLANLNPVGLTSQWQFGGFWDIYEEPFCETTVSALLPKCLYQALTFCHRLRSLRVLLLRLSLLRSLGAQGLCAAEFLLQIHGSGIAWFPQPRGPRSWVWLSLTEEWVSGGPWWRSTPLELTWPPGFSDHGAFGDLHENAPHSSIEDKTQSPKESPSSPDRQT